MASGSEQTPDTELNSGGLTEESDSPSSDVIVGKKDDRYDSSNSTLTSNSGDTKRRSPRVRIVSLTKSLCADINASVESFQNYLAQCQANTGGVDREDVQSHIDSFDKVFADIHASYNNLTLFCDESNTKINECVPEMMQFHDSEHETVKKELQLMTVDKTESDDEDEEDEELKAEEEALMASLERFKQLRHSSSQAQNRHVATNTQQQNITPRDSVTPRRKATNDIRDRLHEIRIVDTPERGSAHSDHGGADAGIKAVEQLTKSLINTVKQTKHNAVQPDVFHGDPLHFDDWEGDFEDFVEAEGYTGKDRLKQLKRFVTGEARDAISGLFIQRTEAAYDTARRDLRERFGAKHNIGRALRDKLRDWPTIHNSDPRALRKFGDFLSHVKSAIPSNPELTVLNTPEKNEELVAKLPAPMIKSWAKTVKQKRKLEQCYPSFAEFTHFVVDEAEVLDEPIMQLAKHKYQDRRSNDYSKKNYETYKNRRESNRVQSFSTRSSTPCLCCDKNHNTTECYTLANKHQEEKEAFIRELRLCYSCLQPGHRACECSDRSQCKKCLKKHPTALHYDRQQEKHKPASPQPSNPAPEPNPSPELNGSLADAKSQTTPQPSSNEKKEEPPKKITGKSTRTEGDVFLMAMPATAESNGEVDGYILLDTQADSSFLFKTAARAIQPEYDEELVTVDTLNGETTKKIKKYKNIKIRGYKQTDFTHVDAYEWDDITCNLEQIATSRNVVMYDHLRDHARKLAPNLDLPIIMLIGGNCPEAHAPVETIIGPRGSPYMKKTMLGWTVFGGTSKTTNKKGVRVSVNHTVTKLNQLENDMVSQEDLKFMDIMNNELMTMENGSLSMPLPFRDRPYLPNNRAQAEKRLTGLLRKFQNDQAYQQSYHDFITDLIKNGHAEPVPNLQTDKPGEVWYIPHFSVKHPKKNKLRVVFDGSATYANNSLNQHLLQGPDLMNSLLGILCRFRKESVAVACDIEKMYYNFHVREEDRDYLRFLWPTEDERIREYRMTVHLFGATSSPAVATYGLRTLAETHKETYQDAARFIRHNFYVDDGIISVADADTAKSLIKDARELCAKGNLRLHKFTSNYPEALTDLPETEKIAGLDLFQDNLPMQRTLGLEWSLKDDKLVFTGKVKNMPETRRGILSVVSQIFDPLGLLAPFTLLGKQILQQINQSGADWDDDVPNDIQQKWREWLTQLNQLETLSIPRCTKASPPRSIARVELHHFSDASFQGIGACSYIRYVYDSDESHVSLVLAKSRVIPSKGVTTIPRLELQGASLASQLSTTLKKELDTKIDQEYFWCDSKIVLGYIANEAKRFHVYVTNRVYDIKKASEAEQWHHVSGEENPADMASRGGSVESLADSSWYNGPPFLYNQEDINKKLEDDNNIPRLVDANDPEVKYVKTAKVTAIKDQLPITQLTTHYSEYSKLKRVVAYLQDMIKRKPWLKANRNWTPQLTAEKLRTAETTILLHSQKEYYKEEIAGLQTFNVTNKKSSLLKLNPYLDENGVIRVGGRAQKSTILKATDKHPVIVPKQSRLAALLIRDVHGKSHHLGRSYTQTALRQAGFWVMSGPRLIKDILQKCLTCRKLRGCPTTQLMGELPPSRVEDSPPFTHVGMDCFGPFIVKEKRTEMKKYGLIFTCMYSRAVHIELLDDLTTDAFLNALRCFEALRGPADTLYCDNGTNFIGARNKLNKELANMMESKLKQYLAERMINFRTSTPTASHQGGVWERLIRSTRNILSEIFEKQKGRFDISMLRTAFYEAMATINSRPLSLTHLNNEELLPLTPNSILSGKITPAGPPPGDLSSGDYVRSRWKRVQAAAEEFWRRWTDEYLQTITKRQVWKTTQENISVGDAVLVMDKDRPRNLWKIGTVTVVHPGGDNQVRKASVKMASPFIDRFGKPMEEATVLDRPIQKLVILMKSKDMD